MTEVQYLNGHVTSLGQDKYEIDCLNNVKMCRLWGLEDLYAIMF